MQIERYKTLALFLSIILIITCLFAAKFFLRDFRITRNIGKVMYPTIADGKTLLVQKRVKELKRGDIVTFRYPMDPSVSFIQRIIGLPGEEIVINEGKVFINGSPLDEPYLNLKDLSRGYMERMRIPNTAYFVMGDNRKNSNDSRFWGPLYKDFILGKIFFY